MTQTPTTYRVDLYPATDTDVPLTSRTVAHGLTRARAFSAARAAAGHGAEYTPSHGRSGEIPGYAGQTGVAIVSVEGW